ncbi:MAG: htrA 4 [Deltaproteobacteria bacterium]|nr:htrA 4 [Deltaproteobacteria bacterium]
MRDVRHLRNLVAATAPGTTLKLEILRDKRPTTVTATIDAQAEEPAAEAAPAATTGSRLDKLGIVVQRLTPELAKQLRVDAIKGLAITEVSDDGLAAFAGLKQGDVIVEANRIPVATSDDLARALTKSKDSVLLLIKRQEASMFIVLRW